MPARTADHQPTTRGRGIPCDLVVGKVEAGWRGTAIDCGLQGPLAAFAFEDPQVDLLGSLHISIYLSVARSAARSPIVTQSRMDETGRRRRLPQISRDGGRSQ